MGVQNKRDSEEMSLLVGPQGLAASVSVWLRVTSGKGVDGRVRLQPPGSPQWTWPRKPLGLGGGSWGRPGADGAGFSETLLRERQFCEGAELFAGGQRKRYLRPPPGEWAGNPLSGGQPVQRAGSPQRLQAGGSGV